SQTPVLERTGTGISRFHPVGQAFSPDLMMTSGDACPTSALNQKNEILLEENEARVSGTGTFPSWRFGTRELVMSDMGCVLYH
ncbi:MAG: hypothetical protein AAB332_08075, partial [Planctomycetota bacterium]